MEQAQRQLPGRAWVDFSVGANTIDVQLDIYAHMVHVWHFTWRIEPQGRQALAQIGRVVQQRVAAPASRASENVARS